MLTNLKGIKVTTFEEHFFFEKYSFAKVASRFGDFLLPTSSLESKKKRTEKTL